MAMQSEAELTTDLAQMLTASHEPPHRVKILHEMADGTDGPSAMSL